MKNKIRVILGTVLFLSMLTADCGKITIGATTDHVTNVTSTSAATQTISTTATNFNGVNSASNKSSNGLSLELSLDSQTYKPDDTINMAITENNTLSKTNNIPVMDKWQIAGLSVGICGTFFYPFGIAVLQGDYDADNLSIAKPLTLDNPNMIVQGCLPPVINITAYDFEPSSDIATLEGNAIGSGTIEMSAEVPASSYWVGGFSKAVQQNFEPGIYTVVGGDEWGNLVVLHFTVTNTTTTTTTTINNTSQQNQEPIEVISVLDADETGGTVIPGGPNIEITLENDVSEPIISLAVVLVENVEFSSWNYTFDVSSSLPLLPNKTVSATQRLIGGGFGGNPPYGGVVPYSLTISGSLQDGSTFSFTWEPTSN